jgi:hypothetical protein
LNSDNTIEVCVLAQRKSCSATCPSFKCVKNAAFYRRDSVWCGEAEENCNVAGCLYAICVRRRLLPGGICGETVKRITSDKDPEEMTGESIRLKGKAFRKIGERELY